MRRVMTVVLPVPTPARTRSGPSRWVTAASCAGFSPSSTSVTPESVSHGPGAFDNKNIGDKFIGEMFTLRPVYG